MSTEQKTGGASGAGVSVTVERGSYTDIAMAVVVAIVVIGAIIGIVGMSISARRNAAAQKERDEIYANASAQLNRIAMDLDKKTTESGVYVRVKEGDVGEKDQWGTPVEVSYSQGGVAEVLMVRSAGPDKTMHTPDDIVVQKASVNFKGVGAGIKKNIEETSSNAAKGAVKGMAAGVKDAVKEAFTRKKGESPADAGAAPEKKPEGK